LKEPLGDIILVTNLNQSWPLFYRAQLPQAPYDDMEINWVERGDGTVGVYYVTAGTYMYVWMLPQPDNSQESYAVVAIASEMIDC